jgi:hypothetical protein
MDDKKRTTIESYDSTAEEYAEKVMDRHPVEMGDRFVSYL